jgi:hypothetical protein
MMMKAKQCFVLVGFIILSACATKKALKPQVSPAPKYQTMEEILKNEKCSKAVGHSNGDKVIHLKPQHKLLNEDADIFCVQKLPKHLRFLKVTSKLEPWVEAAPSPVASSATLVNPSTTDLKFLVTTFDLVVYDQKMTKTEIVKPVYQLGDDKALSIYYDFSKLKKFPAYFAFLFKAENRENSIFTKSMPPAQDAANEQSAITGAAGVAMGGFATGATIIAQPKKPITHSVYSKKPGELSAEWVKGIK